MIGAATHGILAQAEPKVYSEYLGSHAETTVDRVVNFTYADFGLQQGDLVVSYMSCNDDTYNDMIVPSWSNFALLADSRRMASQRSFIAIHVVDSSTGFGDSWSGRWAWQTHHFRNWTGYAFRGKTYTPGGNPATALPDLTINYTPQDSIPDYHVIHGVGYDDNNTVVPTTWELEGTWDYTHTNRHNTYGYSLLTGVKSVSGNQSLVLGQNVSSNFYGTYVSIHGFGVQVW